MLLLYLIAGCGAVVHFRGQVRFSPLRQLTSFTTFLSPVNAFMYLFSAVPNRPYLDTELIPQLKMLQDNWEVFRDEARALHEDGEVRASDKLDDVGFNSFFRRGWKRFYLTWYGKSLPSAEALCPNSVAVLKQLPGLKGAMFAMLPGGGQLMRHRDPFAGSLRYHLGLVTPNNDDCRIFVDGQMYAWRDGEHVLFDETYIHWAENQTDSDRIILFCDIERPMSNRFAQWFNHLFGRLVMAASSSRNHPDEPVGFLNRVFGVVYPLREIGKKIKTLNKPLYYLLKYAIFAGALYLLISPWI
ncbi:MAG: aspartyl/asparaginyl beta-hydroxylase domain-containing protein [Pseudomonadota bacterium]